MGPQCQSEAGEERGLGLDAALDGVATEKEYMGWQGSVSQGDARQSRK